MKILIIALIIIGYISEESIAGDVWITPWILDPSENCVDRENYIFLNLSSTRIERINEGFLKSSHIGCLDLSNSSINFISPAALEHLPNLIYLNLAQNQIKMNRLTFNHNDYGLKTLVLDSNIISGESSISFIEKRNFPNLEYLYIRGNRLTKFSSAKEFPYLKHLYLSNNSLRIGNDISPETFPTTLTHLHLGENMIYQFSGTNLSYLEFLTLDKNQIRSICGEYCYDPYGASLRMKGMYNLKHLSLSENLITKIEDNAFEEAKNLISLDLSENHLKIISNRTFETLSNLEVLSLRGNHLKISREFSSLIRIQKLDFGNNKLIHISDAIFPELPTLKELSLSSNNITNISEEFLLKLSSLEILDLSNNRLEYLPKGWIIPNQKIRILKLEDNYFTHFEDLSLQNAQFLEQIFLDRNGIEVLNSASCSYLPSNVSSYISEQSKDRIMDLKNNNNKKTVRDVYSNY